MTATTKVQGTKYSLQTTDDKENDVWKLSLMIAGNEEEHLNLKKKSLMALKEGIEEIIKSSHATANPFQVDLMAKDLYSQITGDSDLSEHNKNMAEYKEKQKMMQDPKFQGSLVSEFKNSYKIREDKPQKVEPTRKEKPVADTRTQRNVEQASHRPEVQSMVSEIKQEIGHVEAEKQKKEDKLQRAVGSVDSRISSTDVEDLIKELRETKSNLESDLARVNKRMEKLDKIIMKISQISSQL